MKVLRQSALQALSPTIMALAMPTIAELPEHTDAATLPTP